MRELTDLEICTAIAILEGATETLNSRLDRSLTAVFINNTHFDYNPLTDWLILGPLMLKYKAVIDYDFNHVEIFDYRGDSDLIKFKSKSEIPRAICLCILKARGLKND